MVKFTVRVVCSRPDPASELRQEVILFGYQMDDYDPFGLDELVQDALMRSRNNAGVQRVQELAPLEPQLSLQLLVDGEPDRAVLHLSTATVKMLADAGASVDFDPYIYS